MRPSSVLPAARLAILYQNDEFGKGYPGAIKAELGSKAQSKYKIPQSITFQDSLPREESGKIFKRRLRDPFWETTGRRI